MTVPKEEITEQEEVEEQTEQDIADLAELEAMDMPEMPGVDEEEEVSEKPAGEEEQEEVKASPVSEPEELKQPEPAEEKNLDDYFRPVVHGETKLVKKDDEAFITAQLQKAAVFEENQGKLNKERDALGVWQDLIARRDRLPKEHPQRKKFDDALFEFATHLDNPEAVQPASDAISKLSKEDLDDPTVSVLVEEIRALKRGQQKLRSGQNTTVKERQDNALQSQISGLMAAGATDEQVRQVIQAKRERPYLSKAPLGEVFKMVFPWAAKGTAPVQQIQQKKGAVEPVSIPRKPAPPATPQGGKQNTRGGKQVPGWLNGVRQRQGLSKKQMAFGIKQLRGNPRGGQARQYSDEL